MNGRFTAMLGLLVAAAGVSGCLEAMTFLSSDDSEVTAFENRDLADSAALAWRPDAQLMAVFAFENANVTDEFPSDPNPGNGRAPMWLYAYAGDNGTENRAFQVTADGQVRALNDSMMGAPDVGEPIQNWQIDSDQAVSVARGNATFERVASQEGAVMMEALGAEEGMSVWAVMAGTQTGQAIAIISAVDGTLILAEAFELDFNIPAMPMWGMNGGWQGPQVEISDSGEVGPGEMVVEYPFSISRADVASLHLAYDKTFPLEAIGWQVVDANGDAVAGEVVRSGSMRGDEMSEFTLEMPGEYTLLITYHNMSPLPIGGIEYDLMFVVGQQMDMDVDVACC